MIYTPHNYQDHATEHIMENTECGLFLDMGLGKTVSTLTAINRLMFEDFAVSKVLVIAPKKVAEDTWIGERDKWDHLKHLKLSIVLGTERQRLAAWGCGGTHLSAGRILHAAVLRHPHLVLLHPFLACASTTRAP